MNLSPEELPFTDLSLCTPSRVPRPLQDKELGPQPRWSHKSNTFKWLNNVRRHKNNMKLIFNFITVIFRLIKIVQFFDSSMTIVNWWRIITYFRHVMCPRKLIDNVNKKFCLTLVNQFHSKVIKNRNRVEPSYVVKRETTKVIRWKGNSRESMKEKISYSDCGQTKT